MPSVSRLCAVALLLSAAAAGLAGCSDTEIKNPDFTVFDPKDQRIRDQYGTFQGTEGFTIFSNARPRPEGEGGGGGGIGVNAYLWRGTLETIDFMPLASADPFGGLIITDWYQPPESPNERLKLQVLIKDRVLRADGLKVSVFRQTRDVHGGWEDAPVDPKTALELEDKILTRARELRVAAVAAQS
jgi:hypothetical protein